MTSSKSWSVESWYVAVDIEGSLLDSTGKKAYKVPSRGTKRDASRPRPPTEIKTASASVHPKTFYSFKIKKKSTISKS